MTPDGARLATLLDGTGVDHLWLAGDRVDWETGEPRGAWNDGRAHTHCSAFVASIAKRMGIYVLRPPDHRVEPDARRYALPNLSHGVFRQGRNLKVLLDMPR